MTDTKVEMVLGMFFLKLSNINVLFVEKTLTQRFYTTNYILSNTNQVQIIYETDFIIAVLDADNQIFVLYVAMQEQKIMFINFIRKAQFKAKDKA